jgi:fatty acid synthase subunit beta
MIDSIISVSLKEGSAILNLQFTYCPDEPYALIREQMDDRNNRIKSFYHQLWFGAEFLEAPSIHDTFSCVDTIQADSVRNFCNSVHNLSPSYVLGKTVPMDFAIVVGWKAIIRALFAKEIDGDLLQLVHLSNSFIKL